MKRIAGVGLALMMATAMMAVPARRVWRTAMTPDGSTVTVRQTGDEFYHYWETSDGHIAERLNNGSFVVTDEAVPTAKQIAARRAASPLHTDVRRVGTPMMAPRGLVVLAAFADVPFTTPNAHTAFDSLMNVEGYDYSYYCGSLEKNITASGSAADYFKAQSDGKYTPVFDVAGPVTLPQNRAYYGGNKSSKEGSDNNVPQMIVDACKLVDNQVDFTLYDNDKDGRVDFVYVIFADKGENDGGPEESIWPINWKVYTGAGLVCYLDGKLLNNFACSGELNGYTGNRTGIGTICHEFGHVIGLPDYYDTQYSTNWNEGVTPNDWSIMDQGTYNNEGCTPPNYSIFDKYFMGWATPKHLAKDAQHYVRMSTDYNDAYQITGGSALKNYNTTDTVYYIENRQQSGWDAYLPGHGMLVWRVVYSQSAWTGNTPNNIAYKPRYTVIAADGSTEIGNVNYHRGYSDPFPGTTHVHSYTPFAGCALNDIKEKDGYITFLFNEAKTESEFMVMAEKCTVSEEIGVLDIGDPLVLTFTPNAGYTLADADCWAVEMGETNELLTYGVDFTYDAGTGQFRIEHVLDDVVILVEAKAATPTDVEGVQHAAGIVQKVLRNGQLIIVRDGKAYSLTGMQIKN